MRTHQHRLTLDGCKQWPTTGGDLRHLLAAVGRRPQLRELRFEMEAGEESYLLVVLLPQLRNLRELYLETPFGEDFELPWVRSSTDRPPAPSQRPASRPPARCTWRHSCRCPLPATPPRASIPDSQPCLVLNRLAAWHCLVQVAAALLPRLQVLRLRNPSALPDCIDCLISLTKLVLHDPDNVTADQPVDLPPASQNCGDCRHWRCTTKSASRPPKPPWAAWGCWQRCRPCGRWTCGAPSWMIWPGCRQVAAQGPDAHLACAFVCAGYLCGHMCVRACQAAGPRTR